MLRKNLDREKNEKRGLVVEIIISILGTLCAILICINLSYATELKRLREQDELHYKYILKTMDHISHIQGHISKLIDTVASIQERIERDS